MTTDFQKRVLYKLEEIPEVKVTTYKKLAVGLGKPNSSRAVANTLRNNPCSEVFTCYLLAAANATVLVIKSFDLI